MLATLRAKGPDWRLGLVVVVTVAVVAFWFSPRPVLAATVRTEAESIAVSGWIQQNSATHSGGKKVYNNANSTPYVISLTVPTDETGVITLGGAGGCDGATANISVDGVAAGSATTGSVIGATIWTSAELAAGAHSISVVRTAGYFCIDFWEVTGTPVPTTTTTTTAPPTTTTTAPPATTTTEPPTTTTTVAPTTTTTVGPNVPESLSTDANALPVSSMLAIGGLFAGLSSGSVLARLMRP